MKNDKWTAAIEAADKQLKEAERRLKNAQRNGGYTGRWWAEFRIAEDLQRAVREQANKQNND